MARRQAGIQLKNRLTSNDDVIKATYQTRWLAIPEEIRNYVKANVLGSLGSENYRPSAAAQCVQYIAVVELPQNLWPNLIQILVSNVTNPTSTEMCKEATLECIGYICQDIVSTLVFVNQLYNLFEKIFPCLRSKALNCPKHRNLLVNTS